MNKVFEMRVETRPLPLSRAAANALARAEDYDWILFTSKHAVEYFSRRTDARRLIALKETLVAAVGPATARAARKVGLRTIVVPKLFTVHQLIKSLGRVRGARILFPRSAIADRNAPRALRARGAHVRVVPLYTTKPAPLSSVQKSNLLRGKYSGIGFRSPSGIRGLLRQFKGAEKSIILKIPAYCIGPTTARAARAIGFKDVTENTPRR